MSLASQEELDRLAGRIRVAYDRRGVRWNDGRSTSRVWTAAAMTLWQCHVDDPAVPIDPELFVASQRFRPAEADPWTDLASARAAEAYRVRVRRIVRQLRSELGREIRLAERLVLQGRSLGTVLCDRNSRLSPMGRYIVARRAARPDLAERWHHDAFVQHECCPLYRHASLEYLSNEEYPSGRKLDGSPKLVSPPTLLSTSRN
ncbi:hypothetical protein [Paludisphaera soli]|uniref:hypothetical protein n=1 Tax=Paludisphaera soli TaxID=2712865 RepID=UPI0013EE33CB|nr:hypothetical protein [Paludisphaera soli]